MHFLHVVTAQGHKIASTMSMENVAARVRVIITLLGEANKKDSLKEGAHAFLKNTSGRVR